MYELKNVGSVVKDLRRKTGKIQGMVAFKMGMERKIYGNIEEEPDWEV